MTKTDAAWVAGFLDGNGFQLARDSHAKRKTKYRTFKLIISTVDISVAECLEKLAKLTGGSVTYSGFARSFGERFEYESRPAQYLDGKPKRKFAFCLSCGKLQDIYPSIEPFISTMTAEKLLPAIKYDLKGAIEQRAKLGALASGGRNQHSAAV